MSFSESSLNKKFADLNNTQQSVQTLSLWLIHHRKHSNKIVQNWFKEITSTSKCERKLTFIYLANDILQNSRKKGNEYMQEFAKPLADAIENTAKYSDDKIRFTLERILNIWKDRKIYPDEKIEEYKRILHSTPSMATLNSPPLNTKEAATSSSTPNAKVKASDDSLNDSLSKKKRVSPNKDAAADQPLIKHKPASLRDEVAKELLQNAATLKPPEPGDLVNMLHDLETSASSDANVRQKIAELPTKVNDVNELKNLRDKNEAMELSYVVNDAISLIDNYNSRLQQEQVTRKLTAVKLALFIKEQQQELELDNKMVEEWQKKLKQVMAVKNEVQMHLQSLPDLTPLETVLKPLPSAGDLFSSTSSAANHI